MTVEPSLRLARGVLILSLVTGALSAQSQSATKSVTIADELSCASCSITTTKLDVGGSGLEEDVGNPIRVKIDARGRIWVFSENWPAKIYNSNGKFLRSIGPRGAGPGEYTNGGWIYALRGDTIAVADRSNGRLSIVGPDLRVLRAVPNTFFDFWAAVPIDRQRFVASGVVYSPANMGRPLHVFRIDSSGTKVERSFGSHVDQASSGSSSAPFMWDLSPAANGRFWSAERLAYRLQLWDYNGTSLLSLERQPDWFRPQTDAFMGDAARPPKPTGAGISADGDILWTFIHVPDPANWKRVWPKFAAGGDSREAPDVAQLYDTIVEAIDVTSRRVIVRTRFPEYVLNTLPGGRVAMLHHDDDGEAKLQIFTLRLRR
jgi:hypothetical protein